MYEQIPSPNYASGRSQPIKYIVIHHWDDPAKKPTIQGVINHFKNPSVEVAAHYVVSGDRIVQMVDEKNTAWHARSANPYTIGIEVDPQVPGNTYATVGRLVREIRARHGNLPLRPHKDFVQTSCPGNLDLGRIDREANNSPAPQPTGGNNVQLTEADVLTLYRRVLNRAGDIKANDPGGVKNYTGKTLDFALGDMLGSQEFRNLHEKTVEKPVEVVREVPGATQPDPDGEKWRKYKALNKELYDRGTN